MPRRRRLRASLRRLPQVEHGGKLGSRASSRLTLVQVTPRSRKPASEQRNGSTRAQAQARRRVCQSLVVSSSNDLAMPRAAMVDETRDVLVGVAASMLACRRYQARKRTTNRMRADEPRRVRPLVRCRLRLPRRTRWPKPMACYHVASSPPRPRHLIPTSRRGRRRDSLGPPHRSTVRIASPYPRSRRLSGRFRPLVRSMRAC